MNETRHICAYYGRGPNFVERLKWLRLKYPQARIAAMVPAGYAPSHAELELVDDLVETDRDHYSPREVQACWGLVRAIRSGHYDLFVVMYNTLQLRLLAALSGARRCECWTAYNQIVPCSRSLVLVAADAAWRPVVGLFSLLWCCGATFLAPVRPGSSRDADPRP